jgi:dTMP kinase
MLIAIEGIDGAGKRTQCDLLKSRLERTGLQTETLSFPRYGQTLVSGLVADYLNGKLGDLDSVDPRLAALLYAVDRFETRDRIHDLSRAVDIVLLDRYVGSNFAYQGARIDAQQLQSFVTWIIELEYGVFAVPRPDLTIYLDVPVNLAVDLISRKGLRTYTSQASDLHERNRGYLRACRSAYQELARMSPDSPWFLIPCAQTDGQLRSPLEISESIWRIVSEAVRGHVAGTRPNEQKADG